MPELKIGLLTVSDRAVKGEYQDESGPAMRQWITDCIKSKFIIIQEILADEQEQICEKLKSWVDQEKCHLILTSGGTGPTSRDVTPEATLAVADKVLDGFGERMRSISLQYVPTAILSRQVAVIRKSSLIINLPGKPSSIAETLNVLFEAVPYCIELIGGPCIETNSDLVVPFFPKNSKCFVKTEV